MDLQTYLDYDYGQHFRSSFRMESHDFSEKEQNLQIQLAESISETKEGIKYRIGMISDLQVGIDRNELQIRQIKEREGESFVTKKIQHHIKKTKEKQGTCLQKIKEIHNKMVLKLDNF